MVKLKTLWQGWTAPSFQAANDDHSPSGYNHLHETKKSQTAGLHQGRETMWMGTTSPRWSTRSYSSLVQEGYLKNVIAHRCVRLLSESAASVPFTLFKGDEKLKGHPLLDLLNKPNGTEGRATFFESLYAYLNLSGNSYLEKVTGVDGRPAELYILRPDRMKVIPGHTGWPQAYHYGIKGAYHHFMVDDVTGESAIMHFKTFHPTDDLYGLSPLESAAYGIDVHNAASSWNKALLDNAARPSGALVYDPKEGSSLLGQDQFDRLKSEMEESLQGHDNARRPLLLEGGLRWESMSLSPQDMDFINAKHVSAREIALAFGVPPLLLNIPGDNTYSNYQEANRALWRSTLLPMMDKVISGLNSWLLPEYGSDLRLAYDLETIPALMTDRQALWKRISDADFMTINEKRQAVGLGSIDGGDQLEEEGK